ncbi:hypothetical protein [Phenylobacterium montanum]|uniref:Uncharacterized protein n=1 Tax=Phenylobacterium montanum TaxID=2823693 RepID=A0A975IUV3_9CAUL|nr:hypothetical protein [Caulobacter sp. S6]QUD88140.1 hypothetical protein KCG34_24445 [Caulobacter sp. S6]
MLQMHHIIAFLASRWFLALVFGIQVVLGWLNLRAGAVSRPLAKASALAALSTLILSCLPFFGADKKIFRLMVAASWFVLLFTIVGSNRRVRDRWRERSISRK